MAEPRVATMTATAMDDAHRERTLVGSGSRYLFFARVACDIERQCWEGRPL